MNPRQHLVERLSLSLATAACTDGDRLVALGSVALTAAVVCAETSSSEDRQIAAQTLRLAAEELESTNAPRTDG